jgi:hypothetical protein
LITGQAFQAVFHHVAELLAELLAKFSDSGYY